MILTDIAKKYGEPSALISSWLRNMNTLDYLGLWEFLENDHFNSLEFEGIKSQAGKVYTTTILESLKELI